jgi:hypothetical protein
MYLLVYYNVLEFGSGGGNIQGNKTIKSNPKNRSSSIRTSGVGGLASKSSSSNSATLISTSEHESIRGGLSDVMSSLNTMLAEIKNL